MNRFSRRLLQKHFLAHKNLRLLSHFDEQYKLSLQDPEKFWGQKVDSIEWFKKPTKILDKNVSPFEKWFTNGQLNASYNCLDVHVKNGFGEQDAIIHDSPLTDTIKKITYKKLLEEVFLFLAEKILKDYLFNFISSIRSHCLLVY